MPRLRVVSVLSAAVLLTLAPVSARAACPGDCDGDGRVTIAELVTLVNMALATAGTDRCPNGDLDGDGAISIDELVSAVGASLRGCPSTPTATSTQVEPNTATPTVSPP